MKRALLLLCFAASVEAASVRVVGLDCLRFVLLANPDTLVCVAPLDSARLSIAQVQDLDEFVTQAYEVMLLRHPDAPGVGYWRPQLVAGKISRVQFVESLIASDEFCTQNALTPRRPSCVKP